ncbi:unnamed protein product [marine sediment metagenome]|uniref:Uncharacterized protein n=1 Tax=marine sediment metagenome TaxID=412755 RepID=X0S389_9ZZZZ
MGKPIIITGLKETQASLIKDMAMIKAQLPNTLKLVGKGTGEVAKQSVAPARDTGALEASIHQKTVKSGPTSFQEDIIAGDPKVVRGGAGPFATDREGHFVIETPTTEYASTIDQLGGKGARARGYMSIHAFNYAKLNLGRKISRMLAKLGIR